jgi:general secretion pathway protein I
MFNRTRNGCFNSGVRWQGGNRIGGFTLLEVMIAVALIAIALVTLIGAQAQSVAIATGSRFDTMAPMLAQWKLTEVHLQDFEQLNDATGNFGEQYPHFSWKLEVEETEGGAVGIKGMSGMLKTVDVTILTDQDRSLAFTVRTVVYKHPDAKQ